MTEYKVGTVVETSASQRGVVKFFGEIHVAGGSWLGLELATAEGKNDGSLRGERYFTCPPGHGLFPKAKASISSRTAPRASTITRRQSVTPASSSTSAPTTLRAPARKASTAGSSSTSISATPAPPRPLPSASRPSIAASTTSAAGRARRDSNVETLQTRIRHLEKQHSEDQELMKDLSQTKDERDRFHGIIQKLQSKCQTLHQDATEAKAQMQQLQADHDKLMRAHEVHEADWELALLDKEMAEERAEQAESELDALRSKLEERDMEIEILREEAELFTTDMTEDDKQEAGYYRLQHENDRLRHALVALKEMTEERERDNKARVAELESDVADIEAVQHNNAHLTDRIEKADSIIEHLRAQVDAAAEFEDVSTELTNKNQELEDRISTQIATIRDLESLKELNDELEAQHMDEAEDLLAELAVKDTEIAEQSRKIQDQEAIIADHQILISKFRELVFELQGKMADAETSRNMTETQVKDTTGRFNEVMDLNRRLRASNVQATSKEITSELRKVRGDEAVERLAICTEAESPEFGNSEPVRAYFVSKSIAAKASLIASLLGATDRQLSYDGGLEEAMSRLLCVEAVYHLAILGAGSDRLWSAMAAAPLADFASYGPTYGEVSTIEKTLDQGLEALKVDEVNFSELAGSFERSTKIQDDILAGRQTALAALPEDTTLTSVRNISASLEYLDSNLAVVMTMLKFLVNYGNEVLVDGGAQIEDKSSVLEAAQHALGRFTPPTASCNKAMLAAQKLLRTVKTLRKDGLYPHLDGALDDIIRIETLLRRTAHEASEWGQKALKVVISAFDEDGKFHLMSNDLSDLLRFFWSAEFDEIDIIVFQLNDWVEDASVLMNSSEIVRGATPWSQKAREVEAARKKNSESSVLLDNLKAEHKATLLSLHERERVIETKSLEIEHLEAKFRDASNKVANVQELRNKLVQADSQATQLTQQLHAQQMKIEAFEQNVARSEQSDRASPLQDVTKLAAETAEHSSASRALPAQLEALLSALQTENHWLRARENADMFDNNLRHTFSQMRRANADDNESTPNRWADSQGIYKPAPPQSHSTLSQSSEEILARPTANTRPKHAAFVLGPTRLEWQAALQSAATSWEHYDLNVQLSAITEEVSSAFESLITRDVESSAFESFIDHDGKYEVESSAFESLVDLM
ncbi:dynein associated protein-domain-containing protein [Ampelomyces quisqualis]|uniref:Dynein associated protein-domain-containing protein n=1 Tax=Ampelomyces quisqualis TaxID=50730 RepID=A0A6A5QQ86_AMPQU|nr:dynein associated protein-domain-containing protein [Ampelomyces quisqualis]